MQKATAVTAGARSTGLVEQARLFLEFRYFALFTVVATYGLIVLGGTVRATDSGTACPDWPLCHGRVIPPAETKVLIEYSHRVVASIVGLLIVAMVFWLWRRRPQDPLLLKAGVLAIGLLALQVIVGGVTVNTETDGTVVAIHLSIALTLIALLIFITSSAFAERVASVGRRLPLFPALVALSVLVLIITGAYVSQEHAGLAYPDWPLFDGKLTPAATKIGHLHYAHRAVAGFAGLMLGLLAWRTLRRQVSPVLLIAVAAAFVLYVAQVLLGASNVWFELPTSLRISHLALASALWCVLAFFVAWKFLLSNEPGSVPGG